MKEIKEKRVSDLKATTPGQMVTLLGWVQARRKHRKVIFIDLADSTGFLQVVVDGGVVDKTTFDTASHVTAETALSVTGMLVNSSGRDGSAKEIRIESLRVIGASTHRLDPSPRALADPFDPAMADHLLTNRHLYLRNEKIMALIQFRHLAMMEIRNWFHRNRFIEFTAPILTPLPLYDDGTAVSLTLHDQKLFLTQCVGFYLEAAIHSFERIYNLGPSFRAEEGRSRRHLAEYWHVKGEIAHSNRDHVMMLVEQMISEVTAGLQQAGAPLIETIGTTMCIDGLQTPFPRISYREAIEFVKKRGSETTFGTSLNSDDEQLLSAEFNAPLWVVGIPRSIEPFPYCVDPDDPELTLTADLIATEGFGELLGIAEKIHELDEFDERMKEKGKFGRPEYDWVRELREYGCVPHTGFGMGLERFIRWLTRTPHVRDTIPFPRTFGRKVQP